MSQMLSIKSLFDKTIELNKIFVGSEQNFSASRFHKLCDNKGATLSIYKSELDHIFGIFCSVSFSSADNFVETPGRLFIFRLESDGQIYKVEQKGDRAQFYDYSGYLFYDVNSFYICDQAHKASSSSGYTHPNYYEI